MRAMQCTSLKGMSIKQLSLPFIQISCALRLRFVKCFHRVLSAALQAFSQRTFSCLKISIMLFIGAALLSAAPRANFPLPPQSHYKHCATEMMIIVSRSYLCKFNLFNAQHVAARGLFTHESALEHERGSFYGTAITARYQSGINDWWM